MADYISREAATKELLDTYEREFPTADGSFDLFAVRIMPRVLRSIPAADVEPVRHSYWESYDISQYMGSDEFGEPKWRPGRFYVCHDRRCRRKTVVKSNYCPNCGCKMDLEDENGN